MPSHCIHAIDTPSKTIHHLTKTVLFCPILWTYCTQWKYPCWKCKSPGVVMNTWNTCVLNKSHSPSMVWIPCQVDCLTLIFNDEVAVIPLMTCSDQRSWLPSTPVERNVDQPYSVSFSIVNSAWFYNLTHFILIITIIKKKYVKRTAFYYSKSHVVDTYHMHFTFESSSTFTAPPTQPVTSDWKDPWI